MDLFKRFASLRQNLERYKATDLCPGPIADTYGVLLKEAKERLGDDPVVASLPELKLEGGYASVPGGEQYVDCGTMLTWISQIQSAVNEAYQRTKG